MQTITVKIAADGSVSYDVKGFKGSGCKELTKAIDSLGNVKETKTTAEFFNIGGQQSQGLGQGH